MLTLNLLGVPEIKLDNDPISLGTAKARALLFYLAVTGQPKSREQLLGLLWGDLPPAKARRNLTATLSSIRKALDNYLLVDGDVIQFNTALPHQLDTAALSTALHIADTSGDTTPLKQAVTRYRGDFLAGLAVKNAVLFEEWVLAESSQIREQMVQALSYLLDTAVIQHNLTQALHYATQLLEIEPWLERAHQQLMLLYGRDNRIDAALAQYEKCHQILAAELGVPPAAETDALYQRLLLARDEAPLPLPDDGTQFIGREQQLAHIMGLITQPTCRLLTIVGLGGMGKTRLAIATAREVIHGSERQFLNGAVFVPLVGVTNHDGLLNGILAALDMPPTSGRLRNQVLEVLKQREMLLVLDNFEELLDDLTFIEQIMTACPDVTLLITSREPLGITAEHRLDLDGLSTPEDAQSASNPAASEAVALFMNIAQQVQPNFMLDEQTTAAVLTLCRLVDGMPLALKLAATWLRALPIDEIVSQLKSGLDILATRLRDVPIRQRSMRAILEQTVNMLMADEAAVLYALSIFRSGFTAPAAQAVTPASPFILSELSARGLIQLEENGRYRLHELTRQFAAEKLEQTAALRRQYAHYFARYAAQAYDHYLAGSPHIALRQLRQEQGNLRQAWYWLLGLIGEQEQLEQDTAALAQLIHPLGWYFQQRAFYQEGSELLAAAVDVLEQVTPSAEHERLLVTTTHTRATIRLAELAYYQGQYDQTDRLLADALPIVQAHQLIGDEAFLHNVATSSARRQGHYARAKQSARRSEQLFLQTGNTIGAMLGLGHIAMLAADEGAYQLAEESAEQLIAFYRQINYHGQLLRWLSNLGNTYIRQGKYTAAQPILEEAYQLARAQNDRLGIIMTLTNLSSVQRGLGSFEQSQASALEAVRLAREVGSQRWVIINLIGLSRLAHTQGRWGAATRCALDGLEIAQAIQSVTDMLTLLSCLARSWVNQELRTQAYTLLCFVNNHPSALAYDKTHNQLLLDQLHAEMSPPEREETYAGNGTLTLEEVLAWVVAQTISAPISHP